MQVIAAAWLLSVGFDFLLHAGLLAKIYTEPSPFLLGAADAFERIPLGYLAFFVFTWALHWLMRRLEVRGARAGLRFGLLAGAVVWGGFLVGLYSISTVSLGLAFSWWGGQAFELGLAGLVIGAAANGTPLRTLWIRVAIACALCFVAVIVLQATGIAPAMEKR